MRREDRAIAQFKRMDRELSNKRRRLLSPAEREAAAAHARTETCQQLMQRVLGTSVPFGTRLAFIEGPGWTSSEPHLLPSDHFPLAAARAAARRFGPNVLSVISVISEGAHHNHWHRLVTRTNNSVGTAAAPDETRATPNDVRMTGDHCPRTISLSGLIIG